MVVGLASHVDGLSATIRSVNTQSGDDQFSCLIAPDGVYQVHLLRVKIDTNPAVISNNTKISWSKLIPIIVTMFIWWALLDRIPSSKSLTKRSVTIDSSSRSSCISSVDATNHVLIKFSFTFTVRKSLFSWYCSYKCQEYRAVDKIWNKLGSMPEKRERLNGILLWDVFGSLESQKWLYIPGKIH